MTTISVASAVKADGMTSCSAALESFFAAHNQDVTVIFPAGRYYLDRLVTIKGGRNLHIKGEDAVFVTHFTSCGDPADNNNAFHFVDCQDMVIEGLSFTTDNPVNMSGRVTAIDFENETYDVQINEAFPVTGREHLYGSSSFDEDGSPDYALDTYDELVTETVTEADGEVWTKITGVEYVPLGGNKIRVSFPKPSAKSEVAVRADLSRLRVGHWVAFRYVIYGACIFTFFDCHRVVLRDIEIMRCSGFGMLVRPRSSDFTLERFNIRRPAGSLEPFCCNADGVHVQGLSGYFKMIDCHFDGLGDDALNIHGLAAAITQVAADGKSLVCKEHHGHGLPPRWTEAGDTLTVYDAKTMLKKATLTVASFDDEGNTLLSAQEGVFGVGDIVANDAYFPTLEVKNCTARNIRARAFLIQTRNVKVDGCHLYGMALPALLIAPDFTFWYEAGPADHVEISNCTFEKSALPNDRVNHGALVINVTMSTTPDYHPAGVHTDFYIHDNTFIDNGNCAMFAASVKGLRLENNRFVNNSVIRFDDVTPYTDFDVTLKSCDEVTIGGNTTDRPDNFLYLDRCGDDVTVN